MRFRIAIALWLFAVAAAVTDMITGLTGFWIWSVMFSVLSFMAIRERKSPEDYDR